MNEGVRGPCRTHQIASQKPQCLMLRSQLALIGVANVCSSQARVIAVHEVTSRLRDVTAPAALGSSFSQSSCSAG
jgi:hypothetical protein